MNAKLSRWLEKSVAILRNRISKKDKNAVQFIEEINLRREVVDTSTALFPSIRISEIVGHYQIVGANSENSTSGYAGILSIAYSENKFQASWFLEGGDVQIGFGVLFNNTLSFNFCYELEGKEYTGLVSYEFLTNAIVSGIWTEEGNDELGVEFARKLPIEIVDPLQYFGMN
ncbi:hypothetical protein [Flavicella sediminum]|uniref:hypothetical protein n=1 Tax=Flavicella sediminum TaxID=2585141 RepID=UPI0011240D5B|nr:hypothetical protein [Flavicella sediminum]